MPSRMHHPDDLDQRLLACLDHNARAPVSSLARQLAVSRTTVLARIRRLEEAGIILGYGVRKAHSLDRGQVSALVLIALGSRNTAAVVRALKKSPQIRTLHTISGTFDLCAFVSAPTTRALDDALDSIRELDGVEDTLSSIILSTRVDR